VEEATPEATPDAALAVTDVPVPTAVVTLPGARAPTDAPAGPVVSAPIGLLLLALAYVLGGLTVYLIHSIRARRDRAQAEALILASSKDEDED
jgi:threonine dehydrogenase-like Zn-dependent dehydrogenase